MLVGMLQLVHNAHVPNSRHQNAIKMRQIIRVLLERGRSDVI